MLKNTLFTKNYYCLLLVLLGLPIHIYAQGDAKHSSNRPITKLDTVWKEHWFEHNMKVKLVDSNADVAVYYDENMPASVKWPTEVFGKSWAYVKRTYGNFGADPKLYVILHQVKYKGYAGGHPSPYFDASHDYRNVIDCGLGNWNEPTGEQIGMPIHEMGHIVTSATNGIKGSPSDVLWGDSKFMEIFNYDVLLNIGMENEAKKVYLQMQNQYDDFPRAGTQWFKNWFFPIYSAYGKGAVLSRYFDLLALHFPKNANRRYKRDLNFGEFVHFWSGATGTDLQKMAEKAFGWPATFELQLLQAKKDFPEVKYASVN